MKFYKNGDLVWQGCLKIPYTLTKDGKKIVDSIYRDRVEDEYTQAGYTPYYTQQDVSQGNYTVVGSPTISSDWVASGFSSSNYLSKSLNFSTANSWEVEINFTTPSYNVNNERILDRENDGSGETQSRIALLTTGYTC